MSWCICYSPIVNCCPVC